MEVNEATTLPNHWLTLGQWEAAGRPMDCAIRIDTSDDLSSLSLVLTAAREISINFISFNDGRGFSFARMLRQQGFTGHLVAIGEVSVDRVAFMQRVGFDKAYLKPGQSAELAQHLLRQINVYYQTSHDQQGLLQQTHSERASASAITMPAAQAQPPSPTDSCGLAG